MISKMYFYMKSKHRETIILNHLATTSTPVIRDSWLKLFMDSHPEMTYKHTQQLDEQRAMSLTNPDVLKRFNALLVHHIQLYSISPAQIFNCIEKDIILIHTVRTKGIVSGDCPRRHNYARGISNWESGTALETLYATGTVLQPLFVLKGDRYSAGWYTELAEDEASFTVQANATMEMELVIVYIANRFAIGCWKQDIVVLARRLQRQLHINLATAAEAVDIELLPSNMSSSMSSYARPERQFQSTRKLYPWH
ncbi:hypothetical protein DFH27DRAFT_529308 [Peziza echinospora]|nr:hypothetical protein DFH27DRAFT_529308 [Peziza echinospora]